MSNATALLYYALHNSVNSQAIFREPRLDKQSAASERLCLCTLQAASGELFLVQKGQEWNRAQVLSKLVLLYDSILETGPREWAFPIPIGSGAPKSQTLQ